jgi:Tol biopolymer transport system component
VNQDPTLPMAGSGGDTKPLSEGELATGRSTIGRYQIDRILGRGGMGIVVAAHDPELDRRVAVKILLESAGSRDDVGRALRREAQALARVSHGNVVSVYDAGVDGAPYLVMQLVEGETLGAYVERVKPSTPEILALFLQAGRGLAAIHAAGLIHRDFKPSNALVDTSGVVRVSDLGLARIGAIAFAPDGSVSGPSTQTNTIAGTPAYMSPEQFESRELTAAADQFCFCVALWEAVLGKRPFEGKDPAALAQAVKRGPPDAVATDRLSKRQIAALRRGLSPDPADRFPSMGALLAELSPPSRRPWLVGGGVAVVAGAAAVAAFAMSGSSDDARPEGATPAPIAAGPSRPAPLEISDARRLTLTDACDEYPSVAPDGTIYYDGIVGPDSHLMAIDPVTRQSRELTTTKGWDLAPAVSPDGKRVAFLRKTDNMMAAYVAELDDLAHPRRLVPGGMRPAWSPDGTRVWAGGRKSLKRYDAITAAVERVLDLPDGVYPMAALELADGRVVVLAKVGVATADGVLLYEAGATTARWIMPASDDTPMDEVLTLAPDGRGVLVSRLMVTGSPEIWYVPFDGSASTSVSGAAIAARKRLVIRGAQLVWSDCTEYGTIAALETAPGGGSKFVDLARNKWLDYSPMALPGTNELLFLTYRTTIDEIWRMERGGGNPRAVPFGKIEPDRISVSHDGRLIAGANSDGLYVGPLDGSTPPQLLVPFTGSEQNATFSRDGATLVFEHRDGKRERIATIPVGGGEPAWLLPAPSLAPAQSPTADLLAYLTEDPAATQPAQRLVMVLDQRTGKARRVSPSLPAYPYRDLRWSPDGKRLLAARRDGQLVELELATGKVLRRFETGADQLFGITYLGDEILVGRSTSAGDIWEATLR